jgi:hypothetical protein
MPNQNPHVNWEESMTRRHSSQKRPSQPKPVENASGRFDYVRRTKFAGSQSALASALDCSQSFLSRVVGGRKEPGPKLLTALAGLPGINPHWALTGEGQPFQAEQPTSIPIANVLLPGHPKDHADLLTGMTESVAPHHARDSAYMFVVTDPFAEHVLAGDRVLLDADPGLWRKNLRLLDDRLCAVRRHDVIELRRIRCHFDDSGKLTRLLSYRSGDMPNEPAPGSFPALLGLETDANAGKYHTVVDLKDQAGSVYEQNEGAASAAACDVVAVDDVVAIAIELFRRL